MHFDCLYELFRPLRLFRPGAPVHEAELHAVGAALDSIFALLSGAEAETVPLCSHDWGAQQYLSLFALRPSYLLPEQKGAALASLLYIGTGGASLAALSASIGACGVAADITETGTPAVIHVSFPNSAGIISHFDDATRVMESILPAHVEIEYQFHYISWIDWERLYATFTYMESLGLSWEELEIYQL